MNSESTSGLASWLATVVGVGAVLAMFHFHPLRDMPPVSLGMMAGLLSWLVYQYLEPIALVRRHAFLYARSVLAIDQVAQQRRLRGNS